MGSYPKSVMALGALWILELTSRSGFRERAQPHVSTPCVPGNVEGADFSDSLGRNAGWSEGSELAPETESVAPSLEPREIGHARGLDGRRNDTSRHHGRPSALRKTHNSLMQNLLSAITLLEYEPVCSRRGIRNWNGLSRKPTYPPRPRAAL